MKKSSSFKTGRFGVRPTEEDRLAGFEVVRLNWTDPKMVGFELKLCEEVVGLIVEDDELLPIPMEGENFGTRTELELGKAKVGAKLLEVSSGGVGSLNCLVAVSTSVSAKEGDNSVNS